MGSNFDSFDRDPMGNFMQSKCGARGRDYFDGWYIGGLRRSSDSKFTFAYSEDQGLTWKLGRLFGTGSSDLEATNLTWTYKQTRVGGTDRYRDNELNGSGSYQTSNLVYDATVYPYDESCILSASTGVGGNGVLRSINQGKTWLSPNIGITPGTGCRPFYGPNGYFMVCGYKFESLTARFYASLSGDYGATWTPIKMSSTDSLSQLSSIGSGMVWYKAGKYYAFINWSTIVLSFGVRLYTSPDGITWTISSSDPDIMASPATTGFSLGAAIVMPSGRVLTHGRTYNSTGLVKSDDNGLNWSQISTQSAHMIHEDYSVYRLVLSGGALTIEKSIDDGDSWVFYSNGPSGSYSSAQSLLCNKQRTQ